LIGEHFDGHDFINNVLLKSSSITLSNKEYNINNNRVINVDNTLESLGKIARSYRQLLGTKIIGITGSTGKTSVKEYLAHILSFKAKTGKTSANENNYIGTAKTLLGLSPNDKFAVVELGTNHFGEIDWLTSISLPDLAIITNIGASHLEFLQDIDGVFKEKKAIFEHQAKICLFPGDDDHFKEISGKSFGFKEINDYQISDLSASETGFSFKISGERYDLPLFAKFQVVNACIAIAASLELGLSINEIKHGLSTLPELPMRLQRIKRGNGLVIADCYNANPQSMKSALEFWQQYEPDKPHLAILGSMLELGHNSQIFHNEIGELLKNNPEYIVISIGEEALAYRAVKHYENVEYLLKANELENIDDQTIILVKGSHGVHLEKLLRRIT
jgi:UDP-N-acetylmuramoyl-tripeptide--D-alanyl-D-alanine ligase